MRASTLLSCLCLAALATAAAAKPLTSDDQIRQALVGNTLSGEEDGATFTEFLNPDGRILGEEPEGRYTGHWHIAGAQLCMRYAEEDGKEGIWDCSQIDVGGAPRSPGPRTAKRVSPI